MTIDAYVRRETAISAVINAAFSALFFWLVFGGVDPVPLWGRGNWVFDFVPQGFMVALMSTLVPGALAAKALRAGAIHAAGRGNGLPGALIPRALVLAVGAAALGTAVMAVITVLSGVAELRATTAAAVKVGYGAALALLVTPLALRRALAHR